MEFTFRRDRWFNRFVIIFVVAMLGVLVWAVVDDMLSDSDPFYQFDAMSDEDKLDWFELAVGELRILLHSDITVKQSSLDAMKNPFAPREEWRSIDETMYRVLEKQGIELKVRYNSLAAKFNHRRQFVTWQNLTPEMEARFDKLPVRYKPI